MIEIRADGPSVLLRVEGDIKTQLCEFGAAFHAWAHHVTDDAEVQDKLRDLFVKKMSDDDLWHIRPERTERLVEVDDPEELFGPGGD